MSESQVLSQPRKRKQKNNYERFEFHKITFNFFLEHPRCSVCNVGVFGIQRGQGDLYVRKSSFCASTGGTSGSALMPRAIACGTKIGARSCATTMLGDKGCLVGD
jgi:hypothetical protein